MIKVCREVIDTYMNRKGRDNVAYENISINSFVHSDNN